MSGLEIVFMVFGLLLLAVLLVLLIWWLRARVNGAARTCYFAVQQMERDLGLKDRYQTPWIMLLGDEQQTTQLCRSWRLSGSGKPGWFGHWWYDSDAAVLAVPGAMFNHGDGAILQITAWRRLLGMLLRLRANRPLDAVIWTLPAQQLWSDEPAAAAGMAARRKLNELLQRLGLSVPVYMLVTGLESLPGIKELADALPTEARDRLFGWSSPFAPGTAWHPEWSEIALDQLIRTLREEITELGALSGKVEEALYLLPRQFDAIRNNLQALCDPVFHGSALGETPQLRGIYFCAALPVSEVNADPLTEPEDLPRDMLFASSLLRQRVLAEQGLAQPVPRILHLRQRWQRLSAAGAGVLALFWLLGMLWVWQVERQEAITLAALLHELKADSHAGLASDENARQSISRFWALLAEAPRWRFSSVLLPSSLFSSLDDRLGQQLLDSASHKLYQPLHASLQRDMQKTAAIRMEHPRKQSAEGSSPDQWPNYLRARQLLDQALSLEKQSGQFNQMLGGSKKPLDDAAQLSRSLLDLELNADVLRWHAYYNEVLTHSPQALANPIELNTIRLGTGKQYSLLMRLWLDRLFADESFSSTAGQIKRHLQYLQSGQRNSIHELEELSLNTAQLRRLVAATNIAWGRSSGQDLTPGYSTMLEEARQSALIGPEVVNQVLDHANILQKVFREQWLNEDDPESSILRQENGGSIELQDNLKKLDTAIDILLRQDFAAAALAGSNHPSGIGTSPLHGVDDDSLAAALRYVDSYQKYLEQGVSLAPHEDRNALIRAAQSSTAATLWSLFSSSKPNNMASMVGDRAFAVSAQGATEVVVAFESLGRQDMANALLEEMDRRAMSDIDDADAELQTLALYQPLHGDFTWWDGQKNAGLHAYRASTPQEMQQYLAGQLNLITDIHERIAPALDWLETHQAKLAAGNEERLQRWQAMGVELKKYKDKNPNSAPALFERFAAKNLNGMELMTCHSALADAELPNGLDEFSQRARNVANLAAQRCSQLQEQTAAIAWNRLTSYFSLYLAGRFPFSYSLDAADADPDRVLRFLKLLDENLTQAQTGLAHSQSPEAPAAADFLNQLQQSKVWLEPLFLRNQEGVRGIDLEVRWRTDREAELGAEQVIKWSVDSGSSQISYPGEDNYRLRWTLGQPVKLLLRWAKDGKQKPAEDPLQPALAVFEREAGWEYEGPWALLRLLRDHVAFERLAVIDYSDTPLAFKLPVYAPYSSDNHALMFMRVALMSAGGKSPLALAPLPVKAPIAPFSPHSLPDSLAASPAKPWSASPTATELGTP